MARHDVPVALHDISVALHDISVARHDVSVALHDIAVALHDISVKHVLNILVHQKPPWTHIRGKRFLIIQTLTKHTIISSDTIFKRSIALCVARQMSSVVCRVS